MKTIVFLFAIVVLSSLMTIIDANAGKKQPKNLFRERLLDSLEAKRLELLLNKYKESNEELRTRKSNRYEQDSDEDNNGRQYVRRKVVGISDNWF